MRQIIFLVSFFTYSGYYAGLAILFSLNLASLSRNYSIPLRLLLAGTMVYYIQKNLDKINIKKINLIIFFLIFWIYYFVKVLYTESSVPSSQLTRPWFEFVFFAITYVILPFITFTVLNFNEYKRVILNAFIFSGFVLGSFSLYIYGGALGTGIGRISNLSYETGEATLSPLALSYSGSLTIVLCILKLLRQKENSSFQKVYLWVTIVLAFIIFLLGSSRGSIVSLLLSLIIIFSYTPLKHKFKLICLSIISIPVIIWAIEASGSSLIKRTSNIQSDGGGGRDLIWSNAFNHFLENPIFGGKVEIGGGYPHNIIIEILMATGIIGALLILPLIIKSFSKGFKMKKEDIFVFLIFIHGFTLHLFSGALWGSILIFTPMGILLTYSQKSHTTKTKEFVNQPATK